MIDQIIPPDLAEGMSRIEFNEPTAFYYNNGELTYSSIMPTNHELDGGPFASKTQTAPVWCQAFDWFRKRGYNVDVDSMNVDGTWYYKVGKFRYKEEDGLSSIQEARIKALENLIYMHETRRIA